MPGIPTLGRLAMRSCLKRRDRPDETGRAWEPQWGLLVCVTAVVISWPVTLTLSNFCSSFTHSYGLQRQTRVPIEEVDTR